MVKFTIDGVEHDISDPSQSVQDQLTNIKL